METTLIRLIMPEYILVHFEYEHAEEISMFLHSPDRKESPSALSKSAYRQRSKVVEQIINP